MKMRSLPLVRWCDLYERKENLNRLDKNYLRKIIGTILYLSEEDQIILTNQYLNLNDGDTFNARTKSDQFFADEFGLTLNEWKIKLSIAVSNFNESWKRNV